MSAAEQSPYSQKHSASIEQVLSEALDATFTSEPEDPLHFLGKFVLGRARASPSSTAYTEKHCGNVEKVLSESVDEIFKQELENPLEQLGKMLLEKSKVHSDTTKKMANVLAMATDKAAAVPLSKSKGEEERDPDSEWSYIKWAKSLQLHETLMMEMCRPLDKKLKDLPVDHRSAAELEYVRTLTSDTGCSHQELKRLIEPALERVAWQIKNSGLELSTGAATFDELSDKFADTKEMVFGSLDVFNEGLEGSVGQPNPKLHEAMYDEHTAHEDSYEFFTANNYGVKTKSIYEWFFVADPDEGRAILMGKKEHPKIKKDEAFVALKGEYPVEDKNKLAVRKRRYEVPLSAFDASLADVNSILRSLKVPPLRPEEVIGCRLYTGPMFEKYNVTLRRRCGQKFFMDKYQDRCKGNLYSTTIWVINSAIIKLSKQTVVNRVYRGVSGFELPTALKKRDMYNVMGGVEFAFLSTTTDRKVAMNYAGVNRGGTEDKKKFGIVIEIQPGLVDRGADLSWLSQYPFEAEILFAPLTALEVLDRRIEENVMVLEVRPTVNQGSKTIDDIVAKLQQSHVQFLTLLSSDFKRSGFPEEALKPLQALKSSASIRQAAWFNSTVNYDEANKQALIAKRDALRMLKAKKTWESHQGQAGIDTMVIQARAEAMFRAATLCAIEGEVDVAIATLFLSFEACDAAGLRHPKLSKADEHIVNIVQDQMSRHVRRASEVSSPASEMLSSGPTSASDPSTFHKIPRHQRLTMMLTMMQMLLSQDTEPFGQALQGRKAKSDEATPWAATIVALAVGESDKKPKGKDPSADDEYTMQALVQLLWANSEQTSLSRPVLRSDPTEPGKLHGVLANLGEEDWAEAIVEKVHDVTSADDEEELRKQAPMLGKGRKDNTGKLKHTLKRAYDVRLALGERRTVQSVLPFGTGGGGALLRAAASRGSYRLVHKLLDKKEDGGANVSVLEATLRAETALHLAAYGKTGNHAEVCKILRKAGADPFTPSMDGFRAYDIAVTSGSTDVRLAIKPSEADLEAHQCCGDDECPALIKAASSAKQEDLTKHFQRLFDRKQLDAEEARNEVNAKGKHDVTALMLACDRGHEVGVRGLLKLGADVMAHTQAGCTALTMAAGEGRYQVIADIFLEGFEDHNSDTCSFKSEQEKKDKMKELANATEDPHPKGGVTALMRAAQGGYVDVAQLLISHNAEVDTVREDTKRTAMISAARNGHHEMVSLLLQHQADPSIAGKGGHDALHSAALFGQTEVIRVLGTTLAKDPKWETMINRQDDQGLTPLALTARYGYEEATRALLQFDAKANIGDKRGRTPLSWACARGHSPLIPNLLDAATCRLGVPDNDGFTPMMLCAREGHEEAVQMMVDRGALEKGKDDDGTERVFKGPEGKTALMLAAGAGRSSLIPLLTQQKQVGVVEQRHTTPATEEVDDNGQTALMHAAKSGNVRTVRALLQAGADRYAVDKEHRTALMVAFEAGHKGIVDEFYSAIGALERQRPPLLALSGAQGKNWEPEVTLGVGTLIVDVGTGEMKILAALHFNRVQLLELKEIKWAPTDKETGEPLRVPWKPPPGTEAAKKGKVSGSKDIFMWEPGDALDESKMTPVFKALCDEFADAIDKAKKLPEFERVTWTDCFIGATAWYRLLNHQERAKANVFLNALEANVTAQLIDKGLNVRMKWDMLKGEEEARCEWKAVEYAMREATIPPLPPGDVKFMTPSVLLTGGSGSCQVTGLDSFFSFNAPLKEGTAMVQKEGIEAWQKAVKKKLDAGAEGLTALPRLLSLAAERAQSDGHILGDRVSGESIDKISVVLISAFYYVAMAAGLVKKGEPYRYQNASTVCRKLKELHDRPDADPKDVANAVRLHTLITDLFEPTNAGVDSASVLDKVECLFARDWTLGSAELKPPAPIGVAPANFRFTWTAGWWIDRLIGMFAHDISPLSQHESAAANRVGMPSQSEVNVERERYEMEVRMGRLRMGLEKWAQVKTRGTSEKRLAPETSVGQLLGRNAGTKLPYHPKVDEQINAEAAAKPLVIFDEGPSEERNILVLKLSERFFLDEKIRDKKILPYVLPMGEFVREICYVKKEHQPSGDLFDFWLRLQFGAAPVRYTMLKKAFAERKLLIVVAGMEEVPSSEQERMDSYVITTLGMAARVLILCSGEEQERERFKDSCVIVEKGQRQRS